MKISLRERAKVLMSLFLVLIVLIVFRNNPRLNFVLREGLRILDAPLTFYASFFPDNLPAYHLTFKQNIIEPGKELMADFKAENQQQKIKAWFEEDKSWQLVFETPFEGKENLRLVIPEDQEYFLPVFSFKMAQKMGIEVPEIKLVNLFINGKRQGVYLMKEAEGQEQEKAWRKLEKLRDDQFFEEVKSILDLEKFLTKAAHAEIIDSPSPPLARRILNKPEWFFLKNKILWQYLSEQDNGEEDLRVYEEIIRKAKKDFYKDRLKPFTNLELLLKIKKDKARLKERYEKIINELEQSKANVYLRQKTKLNSYSDRIAALEIESGGFTSIYLKELEIELEATPSAGFKFYRDENDNFTLDPEDVLLGDFKKEKERVYKIEPEKELAIVHTGRELYKGIFYPNVQSQDFFITSSQPFLIKDVKTKINNAVTGKKAKSVTTRFLDESVFQYLNKVNLSASEFTKEYPLFKRKNDKTFTPHQDSGAGFTIKRGVYSINKPIIIPQGLEIEIQPGAVLKFARDVFFLSYGRVRAEGTSKNPIIFTSQKPDEPWGVLGLVDKGASGSKFTHIILENASLAYVNGILFSGGLAAHYADITIEESFFQNNHGDDAINVKHARTEIRNSRFINNEFDAIDLDSTDGMVENNVFVDNGNDAFDISFSKAHFKNNKVQKSGDKCVSVGERSEPEIYENELEGCPIGVAVKDLSKALIYNNKIIRCQTAISAYQKKEIFGGGEARIKDNEFIGNGKNFEKDEVSSIEEF